MSILDLTFLLGLMPPPGEAGKGPPAWVSMFPILLMLVVMYFITIRPQQARTRQHAELMKGLKPNDRVLTSVGIEGVVVSVGETLVTIRSGDSKLDIRHEAISQVIVPTSK